MKNNLEDTNSHRNLKLGIIYAFITLIAVSLQPIITRSRPDELDPILYAISTVVFESLLILPIMIVQMLKRNKSGRQKNQNNIEITPKSNKKKIIAYSLINGLVFAIAQVLFYFGFDNTADSTLGSLAVKAAIIYTLLSGWFFLHEKASLIQIIFTCLIIFGLIFTFTQGTFNFLSIDIGTIVLALTPLLWTIGHTMTKPLLLKQIMIPSQVIFLRTSVSGVLLIIFYSIFNPFIDIFAVFNPLNIISGLMISLTYLVGHYFWYSSIKNIDLSISSAIQAPQPIITSILAFIVLQENFTIFHLIGLIVIVGSIIVILHNKQKVSKKATSLD